MIILNYFKILLIGIQILWIGIIGTELFLKWKDFVLPKVLNVSSLLFHKPIFFISRQ